VAVVLFEKDSTLFLEAGEGFIFEAFLIDPFHLSAHEFQLGRVQVLVWLSDEVLLDLALPFLLPPLLQISVVCFFLFILIDELVDVDARELQEAERFSIVDADVILVDQTAKVVAEVEELLIPFLVREEGQDRDPIVDLEGEGEHRVVHQDQILQVPVCDHPQVLDEAVVSLHTLVSVEPVLDELLLWVQVVQNSVRVLLVRGSEHHHLVGLVRLLQTLVQVRPHIYPSIRKVIIKNLIFPVQRNSDDDVRVLGLGVPFIEAVDEGLVEVQDQGLFDLRVPGRREEHLLFLPVVTQEPLQQGNRLQCVVCLDEVLLVDFKVFVFGGGVVGGVAVVFEGLVLHHGLILELDFDLRPEVADLLLVVLPKVHLVLGLEGRDLGHRTVPRDVHEAPRQETHLMGPTYLVDGGLAVRYAP